MPKLANSVLLNEPSPSASIALNTEVAKAASFTPNEVKYVANSSAAMPPSALVSMASKINGKVASIDALFEASVMNYIQLKHNRELIYELNYRM